MSKQRTETVDAPASTEKPDLYDEPTLIERLGGGIDPSTLWRQRRAGKFPEPIRIGRLKRYRRVDIERWLEEQAQAAVTRQAANTQPTA